jgi:hypothetical protein
VSLRSMAPPALRDTGRQVVATLGAASARLRTVPDFLIAGAQRCGTTSLYRMLVQHPAVVPPAFHKGIHYFDTAGHFARGFDWYRGHFPLNATIARRTARWGSRALTGEASPYYVFHPLAAGRIAEALPHVKVIVLLRDPVERAYSAHKQEVARGFENELFERALELEQVRLAGETDRIVADPTYQSFAHQHHAYVARGEYAGQLERLFGAVGRDRVLVLDVDELMGEDRLHWRSLLEFLDLSAWGPPRITRANARPSAPMSASVRQRLTEHFASHDERLAALLGQVPPWRRT